MSVVNRLFGTWRGAVRLALSYAEVLLPGAPIVVPRPDAVRRLVFVCHGNICRSAYADVLARNAGMRVASFGLSTSADKPAHEPVIRAAQARGVDLSAHRTTKVEDFIAEPGDYLLAMELRHLRRLAGIPHLRDIPRGLLGSFALPPLPHLHDPYKLDPAFLETSLTRIEAATRRACARFPNARSY